MLRPMNTTATATFMLLIDGLQVGQSRKIDNTGAAFMAVHVERLSEGRYSVTHYFTQNGDLVPDPDVEFFVSVGRVWPLAIQHSFGAYDRAVFLDDAESRIDRYRPRSYSGLRSFANEWMANIARQQKIRALAAKERHEDRQQQLAV